MIAVIGGPEKQTKQDKAPVLTIGGFSKPTPDDEGGGMAAGAQRKEAARLVAKALGANAANIDALDKALGAFVDATANCSESAEPTSTGEE
jgi:hypothetical protein